MGKRVIIFALLFFLLIIPNAIAITTDLKESYRPSETMIIEILGNILEPIEINDIDFKRGHVSIPLEYDVKRLGDKWFIWAIAPENENNYTLLIEDISTTVNGKPVKTDFEQEFFVKGDIIEYNVKPGFIFTQEDFSVIVNLNEDLNRELAIRYLGEENIVLKPGENKLSFSVKDIKGTQMINLEIGNYIIPAYIIKEGTASNNVRRVRFYPSMIESTIFLTDKVITYPFQIVNPTLNEVLIALEYNKDLFEIYPYSEKIVLGPNTLKELNISLKQKPAGEINEKIYAKYENESVEFPVFISLTQNEEEASTPYLDSESNNSNSLISGCSDLGGLVCSAGETCSGANQPSKDGTCCIGICKTPKKSNSKALIGYTIGALGIILLIFILARYRKTKTDKDVIKRKVKEVEEDE